MDAEQAYTLMRQDGREMYLGRYGGWFLTFGGGPISDAEAAKVMTMDGVSPTYKRDGQLYHDSYRYGPTIDLDETSRLRRYGKLHGREVAFVDGTTGFPR